MYIILYIIYVKHLIPAGKSISRRHERRTEETWATEAQGFQAQGADRTCSGLPSQNMAVCQNLVPLVNIKIAGKWMFIPLKMVLIGIDPYPYGKLGQKQTVFWQSPK